MSQQQQQLPFSAADLAAKYVTGANVAFSPYDFVLDFVSISPTPPAMVLVARVGMTPVCMKRLSEMLRKEVESFEAKNGYISTDDSLVLAKGGVTS